MNQNVDAEIPKREAPLKAIAKDTDNTLLSGKDMCSERKHPDTTIQTCDHEEAVIQPTQVTKGPKEESTLSSRTNTKYPVENTGTVNLL